jgi:hypothetical protein
LEGARGVLKDESDRARFDVGDLLEIKVGEGALNGVALEEIDCVDCDNQGATRFAAVEMEFVDIAGINDGFLGRATTYFLELLDSGLLQVENGIQSVSGFLRRHWGEFVLSIVDRPSANHRIPSFDGAQ